jgi:3-(3-hydroxy-phenyl)propionate hydroxylase
LKNVLIVGAGPVGMIAGLALRQRGVAVTVFEAEPAPVRDQRAASLHPTTLEMLDALGVLTMIRDKGIVSHVFQFHDRVAKAVVASFDLRDLADELAHPFVLQYEQYKLTADIAAAFGQAGAFDVLFSRRVTALEQSADGVRLTVQGPDGSETHTGAYVIGCDGGRSTIRRAAGIAFEGFTYPERFVKVATEFDFGVSPGYTALRNYFSDPEEWCNLFKVRGEGEGGLWRAVMPTRPGETEEESLHSDALEARLQKFFPKEGRYPIAYAGSYAVNQRVAATFRQGRVMLAGDSAHVNNPIGGLGMNGGIHDAIELAAVLPEVLAGADDALLDRYSRRRRHAATSFVQTQTIANKKMMEEQDPATRQARFDELARTAADRDQARAFMRRSSMMESLRDAAAVM